MRIAGIVLAGGQARRLGGGDKSLRQLGGATLLDRVIARVRPQVAALALGANGDPGRFAGFGLPVLADPVAGFAGPLAGILAGLDWAAGLPGITHLASFPTDAPFLPVDLVARLRAALDEAGAELACAASGGRRHPVCALWPLALRAALRHALLVEGVRKVDLWAGRYRRAVAEYPTEPLDPFFNVNTSGDFEEAERLLASAG